MHKRWGWQFEYAKKEVIKCFLKVKWWKSSFAVAPQTAKDTATEHHKFLVKTVVVIVVQMLSHVWLFVTPWTAARQAPLLPISSWILLKFMSIELVMPSYHLILCCPLLLCLQSFPALRCFLMNQLFTSGAQSPGVTASASVRPGNIQGGFSLGLTGLISLLSKGLTRVLSSITLRKHPFFGPQSSLWSNSHIYAWLLVKPDLWLYEPLLAKWCLCFLIHCLSLL